MKINKELMLSLVSLCVVTSNVKGQDSVRITKYDNLQTEVLIDQSFSSVSKFERVWNYLYPWGPDHNGSARMYRDNVKILPGGVLKLSAMRVHATEGNSLSKPFAEIHYHSGAVYAKKQIIVNEMYPQYEFKGYFKLPVVRGTWPLFWLTAVSGWPPEIDILEHKGSNKVFQNTFNYQKKVKGKTKNTIVAGVESDFHQYSAILKKGDYNNVVIEYYIDGKLTDIHVGVDYVNKPMWLIINLQMEGGNGPDVPPYTGAGMPGPDGITDFFIKNVIVSRKVAVRSITR